MIKRKGFKKSQFISENSIVFDVESTGLDRKKCHITILAAQDDSGSWWQWMAEDESEEKDLIEEFLQVLGSKKIISFNGRAFDIPFLEERIKKNKLNYDLKAHDHFDLYDYLRRTQVFTGVKAQGQKKLEEIYGLERENDIDGKKTIELYNLYCQNKDDEIANLLLDYNLLDVFYLSELLKIYHDTIDNLKICYKDMVFTLDRFRVRKDRALIELYSEQERKIDLAYRKKSLKLQWSKNRVKMSIPLVHGKISPEKKGAVVQSKIKDLSNYYLKPGLVLLMEGENLNLENLKGLCKETLEIFDVDY